LPTKKEEHTNIQNRGTVAQSAIAAQEYIKYLKKKEQIAYS